jgi:ubiquinone/menaquinone biosynthesis C-methylase UbiE
MLDVPCGTGRLAPLVLHNGFRWIGADISFEMIEVARRKTKVFKNVAGNVRLEAEHMPFKSGSIGCVASIRFIYHVPTSEERITILRELGRISKKWVIIDYNYPNPVRALYRRIGYIVKPPKRKRRLTMQEIYAELAEAGLKVHKAFPVSRVLSDNVILLCTK